LRLTQGLVLGHRVIVYHAGVGQAWRGKVESLDGDAVVRLDRAKWSEVFRARATGYVRCTLAGTPSKVS
jgi:hypothetical protein